MPASLNLVCVVARQDGAYRAIFLPDELLYGLICLAVQYLTGWEVFQVRVPPAVHVQHVCAPEQPLRLRDGDVLDVRLVPWLSGATP